MRRVEKDHSQYEHADRGGPAESDLPFDARTGEPVQDVQPEGHDRCDDVRPISDRPQLRVFQADVFELKNVDARQGQPRDQRDQAGGEQQVADLHRPAVRTIVRVADVDDSENHHREDQQQAQTEVRSEHHHVKPVLVGLVCPGSQPFQKRHGAEIHRIGGQHSHQPENKQKQHAQLRPHRAHVSLLRRRAAWRGAVGRHGHG